MKLDKYINMLIIKLSDRYNISLIEIKKPKSSITDNKTFITKTYNFNYRKKGLPLKYNERSTFYNKKDLLMFLQWLEQN